MPHARLLRLLTATGLQAAMPHAPLALEWRVAAR
jgi:hypothetical protein